MLGQHELMQLQLRADHDHRTVRIVDTFTQQVLAEASLFAFQHVRDGLQGAVARPGDRPAATPVIEQGVNGLLQHALLVIDDDLGGTQIQKTLLATIAVDDTAVQVIEVAGGEPSAVELHPRALFGRDHRNRIEDAALRCVVASQERRDHLEPFDGASLLLPLAGGDDLAQTVGFGFKIEVLQPPLNGRRAHIPFEVLAEALNQLAEQHLIALKVLNLEVLEAIPHLVETVDIALAAIAWLFGFAFGGVLELALGVGLCAFCLELFEILFELGHALVDVVIEPVLELFAFHFDPRFQRRQITMTSVVVYPCDHVRGEINDLFEVFGREIEQITQAAGHALEIPDVRHRRGDLDVTPPFAPNLGASDLDSAAFADDALEADALVFTAIAFPVPGGAENLLAEQSVALWFERAIVNGFWLLDLTMRPSTNIVCSGQADLQLIEEVHVEHVVFFSFQKF